MAPYILSIEPATDLRLPPDPLYPSKDLLSGGHRVTANVSDFAHAVVGIAVLAMLPLGACRGSSASTVPTGSKAEVGPCEGPRAVATDVDRDGRVDVEEIHRNGRRFCTKADMNFDGKIDVERFYGSDGVQIAQERYDFDFDGRLDQLSFYQDGQLVRKELDTNFDNTIDTWLWCGNGWVVRAERDRQRDGKVDAWEVYEQGLMTEARYDDNNDGRVDKWDTYRGGKLVLTRYDDSGDGEPDRSHDMPLQSMGPADDALRCEGTSEGEASSMMPADTKPSASQEGRP